MNIRKAVLMVSAAIATATLTFGVACGGSDEPPDRDSRDRDARRAERATRRASEDSRSSQAPSVSGTGVEPTALPGIIPTMDPSNRFGFIVATPEPAAPTAEVAPTLAPIRAVATKTLAPTLAVAPTLAPIRAQLAIRAPTLPPPFTGPPLHQAVFEGNREKVEELLNLGEDVNAVDGNGKTPLYVAVEKDDPEIAKLLLSWEAHLAAPGGRDGWNILHVAAAAGSGEMVGLLLGLGSAIDPRGYYQWNPLHDEVRRNYPRLEGQLQRITSEASKHGRDGEVFGWTPLHLAVAAGNKDIVELLLDRGSDIEARTSPSASTPLHLAIMAAESPDTMEVVKLLLDRGASIEARGTWISDRGFHEINMTPLHMAVGQNYPEIATLLLDRGADAKARSDWQGTPCEMAREFNRFTLTPLLGRLCRP